MFFFGKKVSSPDQIAQKATSGRTFLKTSGFFFLSIFLFFSGFLGGFSYERFAQREECLQMNFSQNPAPLSSEEIEELSQLLNENQDENQENLNSNKEIRSSQESPISSASSNSNSNSNESPPSVKKYVGSRNSNKFYLSTCSFAKRIKGKNKVWFESIEAGEKEGREYIDCGK